MQKASSEAVAAKSEGEGLYLTPKGLRRFAALLVTAGKVERPECQPGNDCSHGNREHPGAYDVGGDTPPNCFEAIDAAYAGDSSGNGVSGRDRKSEVGRQENRGGGSGFGAKSATGL